MPKLSIVVPVYEMRGYGVEYLSVLLSSIYRQTFRDYDVVISDNSFDNDIRRYVDSLPLSFREAICYTRNPGAKTAASNLNHALGLASGELVKVILQDDAFIRSDALQKIADTYREHPGDKWCLEACVHTNDFRAFWGLMTPSFNEFLLLGQNTISSPSVVSFRREIDPRFDSNLALLMDVEFYFRLRALHGEPMFVTTPLIANRVWAGQTQRSIPTETRLAELVYIGTKYPAIADAVYLARAKQHFQSVGDSAMTNLIDLFQSRSRRDNFAR